MGIPSVEPLRSKVKPATGARLLATVMVLGNIFGAAGSGVVTGCRSQTGRTAGAQPTSDAGVAVPRGKPLRIAMIGKSASNPSFLSARRGAEDRARTLSMQVGAPIEIVWLTPSLEDGRVQAQRILQAVNERVDAILISCSDDQQVSVAIDDAVARGVAVMTFDSDAPSSRRFAYCGTDNFVVGQRLMAEMAGALQGVLASTSRAQPRGGRAALSGKAPQVRQPAKVAVLAGSRGAPNLRRRLEGVMDEATRHPELTVVATLFHVETAHDATTEVRRATAAYPDLAGWVMLGGWPLYNKTLLGDLQADAGRSIVIVSMDALPPQLIYLEKGFAPVLLGQPTYLWGAVGVESIVKRLLLKQAVPQHVPAELVRVTAANLGSWARQLKMWGFGDVPEEYLLMK